MRRPFVRSLRVALMPVLCVGAAACAARHGPGRRDAEPRLAPHNDAKSTSLDPTPIYRRAGLLAVSEPLPFVGSVHYLAGSSPDTTLMLLSLSMANHALTFSAEDDTPRAAYTVVADVRSATSSGGAPMRHMEAHEIVRIASLKDASRSDPSIVFQKFIALAPGAYTCTVSVQDDGSIRTGAQEIRVTVPRLGAGTLSSPVPVYQVAARSTRDTTPGLIANPRATIVFGRDSAMQMYMEGYGMPASARIGVLARDRDGSVVWRDTVTMAGSDSLDAAVISVPASRIGVGQFEVEAAPVGGADTVQSPLFVSFFDEGAIASFEDMLSYLRYFAAPDQLDALRNTAPANRAAAWAAFWRATDPAPTTPEHEGIRAYFARLQMANDRFRDEGIAGWLTDRGKVFITLGEPDQILSPGPMPDDRGRMESWVYSQQHLELVFVNRSGSGERWQLTAQSAMEFEAAVQRMRSHS
ncbi:MAG TPA: GWxTD domain-containing protein [Gemmatimonadaceae bacterium]